MVGAPDLLQNATNNESPCPLLASNAMFNGGPLYDADDEDVALLLSPPNDPKISSKSTGWDVGCDEDYGTHKSNISAIRSTESVYGCFYFGF